MCDSLQWVINLDDVDGASSKADGHKGKLSLPVLGLLHTIHAQVKVFALIQEVLL